jgi:hypothetical protein
VSQLRTLRHGLLRLHKTLLDWERANYERIHGRKSNTELLNAFMQDRQFAWLRPMSQLIVRIDEMLEDAKEPREEDVRAILAHVGVLTSPSEEGDEYARRYQTALQASPDAVFAHRDLVSLLGQARSSA